MQSKTQTVRFIVCNLLQIFIVVSHQLLMIFKRFSYQSDDAKKLLTMLHFFVCRKKIMYTTRSERSVER